MGKPRGRWAGFSALLVLSMVGAARAADPVVVQSAALRLEVTAEPYRYRIIEMATGEVLVSQSETAFTVAVPQPEAGAPPDATPDAGSDGGPVDAAPLETTRVLRVVRAANLSATATSLSGDLVLEGARDQARITFTFTAPQIVEIELALAGSSTLSVKEELEDRQEHYYGVWEYPFGGQLDSRGQDHAFLGVGANAGSGSTSGRAPFYVTSRRYGVYVRSVARGQFALGVADRTSFTFDTGRLAYDVIYGPGYYDVITRYTGVAGGPFMPPLWAFGTMWWADDFHRDLRASATAQDHVIDVATQLQANRIPAASLLIDRPFGTGFNGWGNMDFDASFPDPPRMVRDLQAHGLELVLWIANRAWNSLYTEGSDLGYLFGGGPDLGPAADVRNPAAFAWWKAKLDVFAQLGAKGYKIDRGEQGEQPAAAQNENVTLYARLAQEGLAARHGDQAFVFARNVVDTGRKHTAVWNGDSSADFNGLAYSVTAGLRSGVLVMPMWASDTGGYFRNSISPTEEVFARWLGFSAMSPMMEVLVGGGHTPWYHYSPALVAIARKHAAAHHDLIPYVRSFMFAATRTGVPIMRPLIFEYPEDAGLANRSDQYLYGSELLVAPVLAAGALTREAYLPAGRWLDYNARRTVWQGGQTVVADAPLDTIPVFVREGAIVPRGSVLKGNDNWTPDWSPSLRIEVFPAEGDLSRRFDFYTGTGVEPITAGSLAGKVTIAFGDLGVPGKIEVQCKSVGRVSRNGAALVEGKDYAFDRDARVLAVPFAGATNLVIEQVVSAFAPDPVAPPVVSPDAGVPGEEPPRPVTPGPAASGGCSCDQGHSGGAGWMLLLPLGWLLWRLKTRAPSWRRRIFLRTTLASRVEGGGPSIRRDRGQREEATGARTTIRPAAVHDRDRLPQPESDARRR